MLSFIFYNLKRLFSGAYIASVVIYFAFAWIISAPPFNLTAIYNSSRITENYYLILNSIAFFTFVLFIIIHFREELSISKKEVLLSRLTKNKIFWGLTVSYFLFFFIGFVLPANCLAFVEQLIYAPNKIDIFVFLLRLLSTFTDYYFFWIILALFLFAKIKNEFILLILFLFLFGSSEILNIITQGKLFNNWLTASFLNTPSFKTSSLVFWSVFTLSAVIVMQLSTKIILETDISERYKRGFFVWILERLKLYLSMHHLRMMGLGSQKLLTIFTFLGLMQVIMLLNIDNANLLPFAKIYLGALLPILFSFNQYFIITIDKDAGMLHNNMLRKTSYPKIVMNRWLVLLIPQLLIAFIYSILISVFGKSFPIEFILYILLLNIFCSLFNLFFGIVTGKSGIANLFLLFFIYVQLRNDFQQLFVHYSILNSFNIFEPLLNETDSTVTVFQFIFVSSLILLWTVMIIRSLTKLKTE
jgi:hypothetical protein